MNIFFTSLSSSTESPGLEGNFRTAFFNIYQSFGSAPKTAAINKHVRRANPDFMAFSECSVADFSYIQTEYAADGYTHFLDGGQSTQILAMSKYPIIFSDIVAVAGAFNAIYCEIEVNNRLVGIMSIHTAPDCVTPPCRTSESDPINEPRGWNRTIQMYSYIEYFNNRYAANSDIDGFIIQGDFNEDNRWNSPSEYTVQQPGGITKPSWLNYPIPREVFPNTFFEHFNVPTNEIPAFKVAPARDLANDINTIWTFIPNINLTLPAVLDYSCSTFPIVASELINSEVDSNDSGIEKVGEPLDFPDSRTASDHLMIVADILIQ